MGHGFNYETRDGAFTDRFLPSYATIPLVGQNSTPGLTPSFAVEKATLQNNALNACVIGLAGRFALSTWKIGRFNAATNAFEDATVSFQGGTPLALPFIANDGFIFLVPDVVNLLDISMLGGSAGGVYEVAYSNSAGGWTVIPTTSFLVPNDLNVTGEQLIWFNAPPDFGRTTAALVTNIPVGHYAIRIRATTLPAAAVSISALVPGRAFYNASGVASGSIYNTDGEEIIFPSGCDALSFVISEASVMNWGTILFRRV